MLSLPLLPPRLPVSGLPWLKQNFHTGTYKDAHHGRGEVAGLTAGLATASWLPTALKALTPTPDPGQLVPPSEAGLDCWLAKAGGPLLLGTPRAGIPGVGITLSNPPLDESGRGREALDMGGGRRGLRQNFSYFFWALFTWARAPPCR